MHLHMKRYWAAGLSRPKTLRWWPAGASKDLRGELQSTGGQRSAFVQSECRSCGTGRVVSFNAALQQRRVRPASEDRSIIKDTFYGKHSKLNPHASTDIYSIAPVHITATVFNDIHDKIKIPHHQHHKDTIEDIANDIADKILKDTLIHERNPSATVFDDIHDKIKIFHHQHHEATVEDIAINIADKTLKDTLIHEHNPSVVQVGNGLSAVKAGIEFYDALGKNSFGKDRKDLCGAHPSTTLRLHLTDSLWNTGDELHDLVMAQQYTMHMLETSGSGCILNQFGNFMLIIGMALCENSMEDSDCVEESLHGLRPASEIPWADHEELSIL